MSTSTRRNDTASASSRRGGLSATTNDQPEASDPGDCSISTTRMSDEDLKKFKRTFENKILPDITEQLDTAGIGGQVFFHGGNSITVVTREALSSRLTIWIENVVKAELHEDLGTKIFLDFDVGEVRRSGR
ncbi:hypothetical protein F5Y10DRAFT_263777 [Nemania abortiva]|nr:hypothetical protein F5Y10DRAFT_263777 [Nemania abortiva]